MSLGEVEYLRAVLAALTKAGADFYEKADYTVDLEIDGAFSAALLDAELALAMTRKIA